MAAGLKGWGGNGPPTSGSEESLATGGLFYSGYFDH